MMSKIISLSILLFFCAIGIYGLKETNKELVWNITNEGLNNAYINASQGFKINENNDNFENSILNIVKKIIDTSIYVIIQITKITGKYAIENPQINFKLILNLLILVMIGYIIVPIIKIVIIIYIFINDIIKERKYKKEIERLRENEIQRV